MSPRAVALHHLRPTRWCVLISGRGSNLAAFLEKSEADLRLVISSDSHADGIAKARRGGVPVEVFPRGSKGQLDWSAAEKMLRARSIDAIFLLGFMQIVPPSFIGRWTGRILNLHPSLLPLHPGLKSIERAFKAGDEGGATIHEVVTEVDAGRILLSRRSARPERLSAEAFEFLIHVDEQRLVKEIAEKWRPVESA